MNPTLSAPTSPASHVIFAAFGAGVAYYAFKSGHKWIAYFFAAGAAWNLAKAAG